MSKIDNRREVLAFVNAFHPTWDGFNSINPLDFEDNCIELFPALRVTVIAARAL